MYCTPARWKTEIEASIIAKVFTEPAECVDASFVIDDLEFLYKGGRCSALAAFGANMLQPKSCISVKHVYQKTEEGLRTYSSNISETG